MGSSTQRRHSVAATSASLLVNQRKEIKNGPPSSMLQRYGTNVFPTVALTLIMKSLFWHILLLTSASVRSPSSGGRRPSARTLWRLRAQWITPGRSPSETLELIKLTKTPFL